MGYQISNSWLVDNCSSGLVNSFKKFRRWVTEIVSLVSATVCGEVAVYQDKI